MPGLTTVGQTSNIVPTLGGSLTANPGLGMISGGHSCTNQVPTELVATQQPTLIQDVRPITTTAVPSPTTTRVSAATAVAAPAPLAYANHPMWCRLHRLWNPSSSKRMWC